MSDFVHYSLQFGKKELTPQEGGDVHHFHPARFALCGETLNSLAGGVTLLDRILDSAIPAAGIATVHLIAHAS